MCSLPTMKFNAVSGADGVASAAFSRGGPLFFSLRTYKVRMMKNCPVELTISFKTFRAADGAALNVRSTTLRSTKVARLGVVLGSAGFADFCPRARLAFRAGAGGCLGAGVGEAA